MSLLLLFSGSPIPAPTPTGPFGLWRGGGRLPLALLVFDQPGGTLLFDWSFDAAGVRLTDGERGYESLSWSVEMAVERAYRVYDSLKVPYVVLSCGFPAWEGRIEDKKVTATGLEFTAFGSWRAISDYGPYNALWSDASTARWDEGTTEHQTTYAPERFKTDNNNRIFIAPAPGEIYPSGSNVGARHYAIPHGSDRNMTVVQFVYSIKLGEFWTARLRAFSDEWTHAATTWSLAGAVGGPVQSGAIYATLSSKARLAFELVCNYPTSTTLGTPIPDVNTTLSPSSPQVNTTYSAAAIANTTYGSNIATGSQVVTPASMSAIAVGEKLWIKGTGAGEVVSVTAVTGSTFTANYGVAHTAPITIQTAVDGTRIVTPTSMTGIAVGSKLLFNTNSILIERVTVSAVTGSTFTTSFKNTHIITGGEIIRSADDWAVPEVDTTVTSGFVSGSQVVTPDSMANIVAGMKLVVGYGGEAEELVTVASVTPTTFTATFAYAHPINDKIRNGPNSCTVRPQSMTGIAVGMRLDIAGRGAETVEVTAVSGTTFTAIFENGHPGDAIITRSKIQTVTPSSMSGVTVGRTFQIGNDEGVSDSQIEDVVVLAVTGSTFTAEFRAPHGATDSVMRVYRPESPTGGYMEITSLRVATTTAHAVSTTVASSITAGTGVVVTPASMENIQVGQRLVVDGSADTGEMVTVTAVSDTTFTADFEINHSTPIVVRGIVVYASEIAQDIVAQVSGVNPAQLSSSTAGIDQTGRDLEIELYEEKAAQDILGYLAEEGDDAAYEVGVWDAQRLFFRPRGSQARVWYTDVVDLELAATLDTLVNQAYAVYRSAGGRALRTAVADSVQSQARYGLVRRSFVSASTTSEKQSQAARDAYLSSRNVITPRIGIVTSGLFDAVDVEYPLWMLRSGDVLVLRNLPVTLSETVDKVRRFRVKRKTYDVSRNILQPVPELELPGLDVVMVEPMIKQARQDVKIGWTTNLAGQWSR